MDLGSTRPLDRLRNREAVVRAVLEHGPVSRAELAQHTELSKPTISAIVEELFAEGWLVEAGRSRGSVGRVATLYDLNGRHGRVIGIDVGRTEVRAAAADLVGHDLGEIVERTASSDAASLLAQLERMARQVASGDEPPLLALAVATPGVLDPASGELELAMNIPALSEIHLRDDLSERVGVPVLVENDVNMAVVGERWRGLAAGVRDAVFLSLGTGVGMGIIADGELQRGHRGAAGEIAYLPFGTDPRDPANQRRGAFEEAVSAAGLVRRHASAGGDSDIDARTVLDRAASGDQLALRVVREVARDVALAIVAITAVLDPQLVVVGGSIGSHPLLFDEIVAALPALTTRPPKVVASATGDRASLYGAVAVALQHAYDRAFAGDGRSHLWPMPAVDRPQRAAAAHRQTHQTSHPRKEGADR